MKKYLVFLASALVLFSVFGLWESFSQAQTIKIKSAVFDRVELADTEAKRILGLSGRESLDERQAMLFVFGEPEIPQMWMKDMRFPLDIIWIDERLRIAHITRNALPESYPSIFEPPAPVKYALEINAGLADAYELDVGDLVEMNFYFR